MALKKLSAVELRGNICINKNFNGETAMSSLFKEVHDNCGFASIGENLEIFLHLLICQTNQIRTSTGKTTEGKENSSYENKKLRSELEAAEKSLKKQKKTSEETELKLENRISSINASCSKLEFQSKESCSSQTDQLTNRLETAKEKCEALQKTAENDKQQSQTMITENAELKSYLDAAKSKITSMMTEKANDCF